MQGLRKQQLPLGLGGGVPDALKNLADMSTEYNARVETPYFWDIHFAGESIAESIFSKCHFLIQACEHGLQQPGYTEDKLQIFETTNGELYVNVDTTSKKGIRRAKKLGLGEHRLVVDVMMSPRIHLFSSSIFSSRYKGRLFALFRNPVDRAVSMYHYLSSASWDPMYNPKLRTMTIMDYASSASVENNWMTRFLVNKPGGRLAKEDMLTAKEILRTKCLVGLFEDLENSMIRFQEYFGWSQKAPADHISKCRSAVVAAGDRRHDTPLLEPGTKTYVALARVNQFDLEL
eukprot:CAMPEP_0194218594 /NCGR_PEP_ID=MMETSP0156-20130528/24105_1 /TAXON_ID=33649 /ORGANISM="Thalassionema nitzschioides, Strain L26-B" /LENGTH=288 /DNA_ID=CAMNT_0038948003 /DNA_START=344 /DNA_END=1207 /DNA_ORIENTATION=+